MVLAADVRRLNSVTSLRADKQSVLGLVLQLCFNGSILRNQIQIFLSLGKGSCTVQHFNSVCLILRSVQIRQLALDLVDRCGQLNYNNRYDSIYVSRIVLRSIHEQRFSILHSFFLTLGKIDISATYQKAVMLHQKFKKRID